VLAVFAVTSVEVRAAGHPLSEIVLKAYTTSPAIVAAQEQLKITELELSNSKAGFLPSLDLTSSHGLLTGRPKSLTSPWTSSLGLTLTENLYDNHRNINTYKIKQLQRESANASLREAKNVLARDLASLYYQWSQAVQTAELRSQALETFTKQYKFVESQFHQGMKAKKDYQKNRASWEGAVLEDMSAKAAVKTARYALLAKMGVDPMSDFPLVAAEPVVKVEEIPKEKPKFEQNWAYQAADIELRIRPIEVYQASRELYPQVLLQAGANYNNASYLNSGQRFGATESYGANVALTINYNFLDWGIRGRTVDISEHRKNIATEQFRERKLSLAQEAATLELELDRLRQTYEISASLFKNEEDAFNATQRDYREGKVNSFEFIGYQRDYLNARLGFLTARYGLYAALTRYYYLTGELDERIVKL